MAPLFLFIPFLSRGRGISTSALRWSDTPLFAAPRLTRYLPHRDRPYLLHDPRVSLLRCYHFLLSPRLFGSPDGSPPLWLDSYSCMYICSLPFFSSLREIFNFLSILASDYIPAIYAFYTCTAGGRVIWSGDWTGYLSFLHAVRGGTNQSPLFPSCLSSLVMGIWGVRYGAKLFRAVVFWGPSSGLKRRC